MRAIETAFKLHRLGVLKIHETQLAPLVEQNEQVLIELMHLRGVTYGDSLIDNDLLADVEARLLSYELHQLVVGAKDCELATLAA
mmetsp:Transcript_44819/g.59527  ORF Transcript_44819/g.59527 Transcript_44819/m.59527 type:complete len:85 (-) Transcript_44819:828-1082(-)